jgi:cellulose synthase/poly-beta-1,6-N-acetylglucosamine synthase-like glycosyltransferase
MRSARHRNGSRRLVALAAASGLSHVGYPLALAVLTRGRERPEPAAPDTWPALTVLIPAYLERTTIAGKVAAIRQAGYPGDLTILVVAEDDETATAAAAAGATVVSPDARLGKSGALNVGFAKAGTELVIITDSDNEIVPDALQAMVGHFADPTIGAVAGTKLEASDGEAAYWRYESWLNERESMLGTTIGMVGELTAIRRAAWRPIPDGVQADDLWTALDLCERGWRVVFEPRARSIEPGVPPAEQWERRTRISSGGLATFWRKRHLVSPRRPLLAFEIIGHKLWRSTLGPLSNVALVVLAARRVRRDRVARLVLAGHGVAALSLVLRRRGRKLPAPLSLGAQVLYLQLVALGGMVRALRRDVSPQWPKRPR